MTRGPAAVKENSIFIIYFTPIYVLALLSTRRRSTRERFDWRLTIDSINPGCFGRFNCPPLERAYLPLMYSSGFVAYIWKWSVVITAQWYIGRSQTSFPFSHFLIIIIISIMLVFYPCSCYSSSCAAFAYSFGQDFIKHRPLRTYVRRRQNYRRGKNLISSPSVWEGNLVCMLVCRALYVCVCCCCFSSKLIISTTSSDNRLSNLRAIGWKINMLSSASVSTAILRAFKRT